ncbi:MarR family transcriptional regulator [Tateyamaria omphalii]|uniref:MarR family winged helix-turn-helix transcriptional regulator n=1 Tax=Tateyamaria omphalii TaxID=299262 RepID=UPI001C99CDBE|nr:MarR family transcriptional regulator [Tateyamaria omphalii]MBY5933508.1 MarR family transcriptional regulator [Tateyamaria omphalii]
MADALEKTPPLLDQQLCFALYSTSRAITKVYADLLHDLGLTYPQYLAMLVLWEKDGLSIQEIADRLQLEGATTTPLIQRIVRLGLVEKRRSTTDERRLGVFLTEEGRSLGARASDVPEQLGCALNISETKARALLAEIKELRAAIA